MTTRSKKQRQIDPARLSSAEAAALATAAGMIALGTARDARAQSSSQDPAQSPATDDVTTPDAAAAKIDLVYADLAHVAQQPMHAAPQAAPTAPEPASAVAPAPAQPVAAAPAAVGSAAVPLQGGERMIDPAAIMNGGVGGHGPLQTSAEAMLAQSLSTLTQSLDGLSTALHGAVQTLPVAPVLQGALGAIGGVQGAISQVSDLLGQATGGVVAPVNDLASGLIGALDTPQITSALEALAPQLSSAVALPGGLADAATGVLGGFGALGGTDLVTHGLEALGAAPAPLVGLVGLSYAEAIDPFDASHTPLGGVLHGLV